jgi:signal transduction histidine kinase
MRALIFELRPESLETEGLIAALSRRVEALRARHAMKKESAFEAEPELPLTAKEVLYRVAQEALQNVVRHANTTPSAGFASASACNACSR